MADIRMMLMKTRVLTVLVALVFVVGFSAGCTTETGAGGDEWDVNNGTGEDAGGDDTSGEDTSDDDTADRDAGDGGNVDDGGEQDVPNPDDGGGEDPIFEESALEGTTWFGILRLAQNEGITGSVFEITLMADNDVEIGAFGSVTGKWEIFDERRLRVYDLVRDGEPNQPEQFVFDVDVDENRARGLELVIPQQGAPPYTMRLEQLGTADITVEELDGDWQSEEIIVGEDGNDNRLALRFFGERMGYGIFNGAYIEFVSGNAETLTLDNGRTYWLLLPPPDGAPQATFGGELQVAEDGSVRLFAPRQTNPGEEPAEFTSEFMTSVSSFSL
jgi:predicted small secreted protein